jgi:hypothetical protein
MAFYVRELDPEARRAMLLTCGFWVALGVVFFAIGALLAPNNIPSPENTEATNDPRVIASNAYTSLAYAAFALGFTSLLVCIFSYIGCLPLVFTIPMVGKALFGFLSGMMIIFPQNRILGILMASTVLTIVLLLYRMRRRSLRKNMRDVGLGTFFALLGGEGPTSTKPSAIARQYDFSEKQQCYYLRMRRNLASETCSFVGPFRSYDTALKYAERLRGKGVWYSVGTEIPEGAYVSTPE